MSHRKSGTEDVTFIEEIPIYRKTTITPKFLLNKQFQINQPSEQQPKQEITQKTQQSEWKRKTRASFSQQSNNSKEESKSENEEKIFTPATEPLSSFVPIIPRMWTVKNYNPTKDEIRKNHNIYNDFNMFAENKELWKEKTLLDQLPFYATAKEMKVLACTWNINEGVYTNDQIDQWISYIDEEPDIIALGVQELDMSISAIVTGSKYSEKAEKWKQLISTSINCKSGNAYDESGWYQLCGIVLFVFVKKEIKSHIKMFGLSECRTGAIGGKLANKGGVAIGFKIFDSTICFVNSHLAAHQEFVERRNKDWEEISKMNIVYANGDKNTYIPLLDHDIVIWIGDLNYRIDLDHEEVIEMIQNEDIATLYQFDQLYKQRIKRKVFHGFTEPEITFAPTFKVKPDTGYKENRIPSWCDRILYKTKRRHGVVVEKYSSFEVYCSDHKPVSASMRIYLQQINQEKKSIVEEFIDKANDWYKRQTCPSLTISPMLLEFHDIIPLKSYSQQVTIVNRGKTRIHLIVDKHEELKSKCPWQSMELNRTAIEIFEGEDSATLTLHVNFDLYSSHLIQNEYACNFSFDIAVKNSTYSFPIVVQVKSRPSCIGMSLNSLLTNNHSIRNEIVNNYTQIPFNVPKEIYRLVDKILTFDDLIIRSLFDYESQQNSIFEIIESINNDTSFFDHISIRNYFDALLLVVSGMSESLMHEDFRSIINECIVDPTKLNQYFVFMMSDRHRLVMLYLLKFIQQLIDIGVEENKLLSEFANVLMHTNPEERHLRTLCQIIWKMLLKLVN